jgi:tetratricopeptide (TPR) repeat protein
MGIIMRKVKMSKKILTVTLLLVGMVVITGCLDDFKEKTKVEKKLLTGTPNEEFYEHSQAFFEEGNYTGALIYDLKQLKEDLQYYPDISAEIALDYNNVALDYDKLKEYNKSITYYTKVIEIDNIVLDRDNLERATTYYNIASSYESLKLYDKALNFYIKSLNIERESENRLLIYQDIAKIYGYKKSYKQSLYYYQKALILYNKSTNQDKATGVNINESILNLKEKIK